MLEQGLIQKMHNWLSVTFPLWRGQGGGLLEIQILLFNRFPSTFKQ